MASSLLNCRTDLIFGSRVLARRQPMRIAIRFVVYLVLGVATAIAQDSPPPAGTLTQQPSGKPSPLTASEISQLEAKAEAGDAIAQTELGKAYQNGDGVPQNDALALKWLRKAADQGHAAAENDLGIAYRMGNGVERDKAEAVRWYHKAAKQGNSRAMFNLGAAYYNGDGVEEDPVASYAWFLLAHEVGNPASDDALRRASSERDTSARTAFMKIGEMYEAGDELPKNPGEALKWYRKAADDGDQQAALKVATLLLASGRTTTEAEYAEIRQRCGDAAKRNFSPGAYCMVLIYRRGIGTAKDPTEAAKWLSRAADLGYPRAALELGEAYWKGAAVKPDVVTAYMWIWLAFNAKEPGSEQVEQDLRKELSAKQLVQAKKKATDWAAKHRPLRWR